MRIISGRLKGRLFESPGGHKTHPMGERVKSALFNSLGDISGLTVLDTYAGTGALSFEALSRGAKHATMIELDPAAVRTLQANIQSLGLSDAASLVPGNCVGWSNRSTDQEFDIVFCDPPYDAVLITTIAKLARHVSREGILVLSWPRHVGLEPIPGFEAIRSQNYAAALLVFYKRIV